MASTMLRFHVVVSCPTHPGLIAIICIIHVMAVALEPEHWKLHQQEWLHVSRQSFEMAIMVNPLHQTQDPADECERLHTSIMPLNEKVRGPLPLRVRNQGAALPFVILSGKPFVGEIQFHQLHCRPQCASGRRRSDGRCLYRYFA
jgi:hypothetical protein